MSAEYQKMREWMESLRDAIPAERIDEGYCALADLLIKTKRTYAMEPAHSVKPIGASLLTRMEDGR